MLHGVMAAYGKRPTAYGATAGRLFKSGSRSYSLFYTLARCMCRWSVSMSSVCVCVFVYRPLIRSCKQLSLQQTSSGEHYALLYNNTYSYVQFWILGFISYTAANQKGFIKNLFAWHQCKNWSLKIYSKNNTLFNDNYNL